MEIVLKTNSDQPYLAWRLGIEDTLIQRMVEQGWGHHQGCTASYHACLGILLTLDLSSSLTPVLLFVHLALSCLPIEC